MEQVEWRRGFILFYWYYLNYFYLWFNKNVLGNFFCQTDRVTDANSHIPSLLQQLPRSSHVPRLRCPGVKFAVSSKNPGEPCIFLTDYETRCQASSSCAPLPSPWLRLGLQRWARLILFWIRWISRYIRRKATKHYTNVSDATIAEYLDNDPAVLYEPRIEPHLSVNPIITVKSQPLPDFSLWSVSWSSWQTMVKVGV